MIRTVGLMGLLFLGIWGAGALILDVLSALDGDPSPLIALALGALAYLCAVVALVRTGS